MCQQRCVNKMSQQVIENIETTTGTCMKDGQPQWTEIVIRGQRFFTLISKTKMGNPRKPNVVGSGRSRQGHKLTKICDRGKFGFPSLSQTA